MSKRVDYTKFVQEDYEPKFDRLSTERRVLGFVTPDVDTTALGPRNTIPALDYALSRDDNTRYANDVPQLMAYLDLLVGEGLLEKDLSGVYTVTKAGWTELMS